MATSIVLLSILQKGNAKPNPHFINLKKGNADMNIKKLYERIEEIDKELNLEYEDGETNWVSNLEAEKERIEEVISILEENEMESVEKITVTSIQWDAPKSASLPRRVVIEINMDNASLLEDINGYADNLSDYLSDTYGYCHEGFNVNVTGFLHNGYVLEDVEQNPCLIERK